MNYSGEAVDQVVRMSLNGVEVAAKISGKAAERLAVLLYAILKDQQKTRGKTRLTNMLKSGKELSVFAIKDTDLERFSEEAKKYGVLYTVLKDTNEGNGLTDIMVKAEDASKINRIFERFGLATIDLASVKTEIEKTKQSNAKDGEDIPVPDRQRTEEEKVDEFLNAVIPEKENPTAEKQDNQNPTMARTAKSRQSERSSESKKGQSDADFKSKDNGEGRPSVREELKEIRKEQENGKNKEKDKEKGKDKGKDKGKAPGKSKSHKAPPKRSPKKKPKGKEATR